MRETNVLMGIVAIILGLVVLAFPYLSIFTFSVLTGFGILILGIWFLIQTFSVWEDSKAASLAFLILGLIAIVAGIGTMGNVYAFSVLASVIIYLAGFYLLFSGTLALLNGVTNYEKGIGAVGILLGFSYLVVGLFAFNPYYLALIIGIWLIFDGIRLFFVKTPEDVIEEFAEDIEELADELEQEKKKDEENKSP